MEMACRRLGGGCIGGTNLAASGEVVTESLVRQWFLSHAASWPTDFPSRELSEFVNVLNMLRVTQSFTEDALPANSPPQIALSARLDRALMHFGAELHYILGRPGAEVAAPKYAMDILELYLLVKFTVGKRGLAATMN